jgi:hypothetical protein
MKKLIVALCLIGATVSSPVLAWNNGYRGGYRGPAYYNNGYYNNGYYNRYNNNYWVAPAIAGVAVGALAANAYYTPPPVVYVQPPPTYYVQQPAPANQGPANPPPFGYHWQQILDGGCNCYRWAILQD